MNAMTIQQMADRVSELMEERLGSRGQGLAVKLRMNRRALPGPVRTAVSELAEAAAQADNPKLLRQIDGEAMKRNHDICIRYLTGLSLHDRLLGQALRFAGSLLFSLLSVVALVLVVLAWRGLL